MRANNSMQLTALRAQLMLSGEAAEKVPTRPHAGKIRFGSVRWMNLGIEAEHGYDRGTETLFMTETRTSCRDFENRSVIRIARIRVVGSGMTIDLFVGASSPAWRRSILGVFSGAAGVRSPLDGM